MRAGIRRKIGEIGEEVRLRQSRREAIVIRAQAQALDAADTRGLAGVASILQKDVAIRRIRQQPDDRDLAADALDHRLRPAAVEAPDIPRGIIGEDELSC